MKIYVLFLLCIMPCSVFAQSTFSEDFVRNQYKWLSDNASGCICLGWSRSGCIAYLTTVIPCEPVGGHIIELVVTDLITDEKLASFEIKWPTKDVLNQEVLLEALAFCIAKNIEPCFSPLHAFPLYYNNDTYSIGILDEAYNDPQGRELLLSAELGEKYKPIDAPSGLESIAGYFKSPFENRIAICIYISPQEGPTGTTIGGGYYQVYGCHLDVGFKSKK